MIENDDFLERLRPEARQLRFEPDEMMATRIAARVRERIAVESQAGIALVLVAPPDPLGLPVAQPHQLGRLHLAQFFSLHPCHNLHSIPFLATHC